MVQPAFNIGNPVSVPAEDGRLLAEVSDQVLNYVFFSREPYRLHLLRQYRLYTTGDQNTRDLLEEIFQGDHILREYARKAIVVYNFPEADLMPQSLYTASINGPVTRVMHGFAGSRFVFDEKVQGTGMRNIYSVPRELHSLCTEKFKGSHYWHIYTLLASCDVFDEYDDQHFARVVFYNDRFIVAVFRNRALHLIQTFSYQTPEDVAYYVLLICRQFDIPPVEMKLYISGLIDTQSALFNELQKYFESIAFENVPDAYEVNGLLDEFPAHYFSPLLKMSLCV